MSRLKTRPCIRCGGKGRELEQAHVGAAMRKLRLSVRPRLSQSVAAFRMGFSAPYLSDLENGKRRWTAELVRKFCEICKEMGR